MNFVLLFQSAMRSLSKHKMRSLLTTLGIIIGVVAIIAVMSIGEGAKYKVNQSIEKLGSNFIVVLAAPPKHLSQKGAMNFTLKPVDLKSIEEDCDDIALVSPGVMHFTTVVFEGSNWATSVFGCNEEYFEIRKWKPFIGELFTEQDVKTGAKVAALGKKAAAELFGDRNPVGEVIRIKKIPFKVCCVLEEMGKTPDGRDFDDTVIAPVTTVQRKLMGKRNYNALLMSGSSTERLDAASRQVTALLRQNHKIREGDDDDFTIFTQNDISQASSAAGSVLNILLLIIASISLIVGGIGIMNIMLVTVTERTKEIGIRMALGATTNNILTQFILEAVIICLSGGILGAGLGMLAAKMVGIGLGWPVFISQKAVLISLVSAAGIGLFFGYYPAYKASQLNPIDALVDH